MAQPADQRLDSGGERVGYKAMTRSEERDLAKKLKKQRRRDVAEGQAEQSLGAELLEQRRQEAAKGLVESRQLHLPDLSIRNFRGIDWLSIGRLGRVTLLGGRNGVGKTTVLEAVRVHAARARASVLHDLLNRREEFATTLDEGHDPVVSPDYAALFHGRAATRERPITIGPQSGRDDLRIEVSAPNDLSPDQKELFADLSTQGGVDAVIKVVYRDRQRLLWLPIGNDSRVNRRQHYPRSVVQSSLFEEREWSVIECESLGPGLPDNSKLARFWDSVALTEKEDLSLEALRLTAGGIERVAVVGDEEPAYRGRGIGRRVVVKLKGHSRPVSLKSLGDGVTRLFAAGLALAHSRDGFLVLDEAENGIHYSVQQDFWRMVLRAAHQHNVQVLATTHSDDCLRGFARAAAESDDVEGVYLRLERDGDQVHAVPYSEEELETVANQRIEAR